MNNINTKDYWDKRFNTGDWENNNGFKQSEYFAEIILNGLPTQVKKDLENKSILDYACGCGQLCNVFSNNINNVKMVGYDFSEEAINIAEELFPENIFISDEPENQFDAIVFSHVLEHMENGIEMVENYSQYADKYIIISTPYKEDENNLVGEHVVSIGDNYFPDNIGSFKKIESKIIDTRNSEYWHGDVVVVVYKKDEVKRGKKKS